MIEKKQFNPGKVGSIVLVFLSFIMLFQGWIVVADQSFKEEIQSDSESLLDEMNMDKEQLKLAQQSLDEMSIDVDIKKFIKYVKNALNIIKDAKLAPYEIASVGPSIIKLGDIISEQEMMGSMLGGEIKNAIDALEEAKEKLLFLIFLYYVSLIAGIVIIVLHIKNNKLPGISMAVLNLVWWIIMGIINHKINKFADEKVVRLTSAPFWAFLFSLAAIGLWMFKDKLPKKVSTNESISTGKVCLVCGSSIKEGVMFCPKCGTEYKEPETAVVEGTYDTTAEFCANCGAQINPSAEFCPKCGTKR